MSLSKRKVVVIGDPSVGKTSLIKKFVLDQFDDSYIVTVGTKVSKKNIEIDGNALTLLIWDILGQQEYSSIQALALGGASGAFLVADLTRKQTLESLTRYWIPHVRKFVGNIPMVVLGNKSDLEGKWLFNEETLSQDPTLHDIPFILTSAKTGNNVEEAFNILGRSLLESPEDKDISASTPPRAREISTLVDAADIIIDDFCKKFEDEQHGMAIIRQQLAKIGMHISSPTIDGLDALVDGLEAIETSIGNPDEARKNKMLRKRILDVVR